MTSLLNFAWTDFYMEFADKLLKYRYDRSYLIEVVLGVCNRMGYKYLNGPVAAGMEYGLKDICPFTVMGTFNRRINNSNRKAIATEIGRTLGVSQPVPDAFQGIPVLNVTNSVVFHDVDDIDPLWQVFEDALLLADFKDEYHYLDSFLASYERVFNAKGIGNKLTIGLFWARPDHFLPLDSESRQYIANILKIKLLRPNHIPSGREYLDIMHSIINYFNYPEFPVHSFQELSWTADTGGLPLSLRLPEPTLPKPESSPTYTLQSILDDGCFLDCAKLQTTLNRLKSKKNIILQGPPGTGKTWLARRLAYALIGEKDDRRVRRFQFHPNLSYEDFIRGYRPNPDGKLDLVDGPFLKAITDAGNDPCNDYVVVIEEINRGNPAQIFGEMLTLLEADKRNPDEALAIAHSHEDDERVHIPDNLYVIGTMNLADRSIAMVDLALRRRFAFIDLAPTFGEVWRNWVNDQCGIPLDFLTNIENRVTALNDKIASDVALGPQFQIGHSYLTATQAVEDPVEWFTDVVDTEIAPLLDEYWFDNAQEARAAKSDLLDGLQ